MSRIIATMLAIAALGATAWTRVGTEDQVQIAGDQITLNVGAGVVAGSLSSPITLNGDAAIVQAKVAGAPARGLTLALQDANTGESVAYWQYPLEIADANIAAALDVSGKPREVRLFLGSDSVASSAAVADIQIRPSRKRVSIRTAIYGALVDSSHVAGQTFVATGRTLDAVTFRAKQLSPVDGPDLRVRVFQWDKSKSGPPLGEAGVLRKLIPTAMQTGELEITVPFDVKLERGKSYYVEWTATSESSREQALLLYGGDDCYPRGCRYENNSAVETWDLYLETYESN